MPNRLLVVLAAAIIVGAPARALAHDLKATVKVLPEAVVVEAGFDDDTPAEGARVIILDATGTEAAAGTTDERGVCRLLALSPGKYTARVESTGHHDEVPFEVFAAGLLDAPMEYVRARPDKTIGVVAGVGGLLGASLAFWWFRLRKPAS
jgi:hypothetical protein